MDKYFHHKSNGNITNLKFVHFPNGQKTGQFYSEPTSKEQTPTNLMRVKLEPLDKKSLNKKIIDLANGGSSQHGYKDVKSQTPKIVFSKKNFVMSMIEDSNTPKEEEQKKSWQKSKFAGSQSEKLYRDKSFQDSPSFYNKGNNGSQSVSKLSSSVTMNKDNMSFSTVVGKMCDEKQDETPEFRIKTKQNQYHISKKLGRNKSSFIGSKSIDFQSDDDAKKKREENILKDAFAAMPYRHLIFSPKIDLQRFKRHLAMTHKGLSYSLNSLRSPSDKFIRSKQVIIPEPLLQKDKTLLLDLDETLIHACSVKEFPDVVLSYQSGNGDTTKQLPVKVRPYLKEFFLKVSPFFEILVFTASAPNYAKAIVNHIDPERKYINSILTRENCMETKNGFYIKDLRILKNRSLKNVVIVDNLVHSFGFQLENGIPILEYFDDKKDAELKYLVDYLLLAYKSADIREFNSQRIKLKDLAKIELEDLLDPAQDRAFY